MEYIIDRENTASEGLPYRENALSKELPPSLAPPASTNPFSPGQSVVRASATVKMALGGVVALNLASLDVAHERVRVREVPARGAAKKGLRRG